jgi:hypothetical protein
MLYSFCASYRGRPAGVTRKLLCSFHFFETLPDVSSQYIHNGKQTMRDPLALALHEFPTLGSVCFQSVVVFEASSRISMMF